MLPKGREIARVHAYTYFQTRIFFHLKKAFDKIDYDILLDKVQKYGIIHKEFAWLITYLNITSNIATSIARIQRNN